MTDLEYWQLSILLDTKQISLHDLVNIDTWVAGAVPDDPWGWLITWLYQQPDIIKPRLRVDWSSPGAPRSAVP